MTSRPTVAFTVDLEPDCPPFLTGFRGVERGLPALLDMLAEVGVPATFFTTGEVAQQYPASVERVVASGHELACHGMTHTAFTTLHRDAARFEIVESSAILRRFTTVTSFRAPYLKFPEEYVELLEADGFLLDSSQAKYKFSHSPSRVTALATGILRRFAPQEDTGGRARQDNRERIRRVPASVTSSVLRVARPIRNAYLSALSDPIVLFVHPWEFVDLRSEKLRLDCRFKTGDVALACVREVLETYVTRGARFVRMRELA